MRIFISVASFCDPILRYTLSQAVAKARYPDRLHFGIVDQSYASEQAITSADVYPAKFSRLWVNPVQSRGCSWARANAMSLYDGEEWFFQIDSHMDFNKNWDEILINHAIELSKDSSKIVISSYPTGFDIIDNIPSYNKIPINGVLTHVVKPDLKFGSVNSFLVFEGRMFISEKPIRGFHLGAGCLFTNGQFVNDFPYDPFYYFHGEEQALSVRLYTHGWDIYHIPELPIFHSYNKPIDGKSKRPLHWDAEIEKNRHQKWYTRNSAALKRLDSLLQETQNLGAYGLGTIRSMKQYSDFSGIDYKNRSIAPKAYKGYWTNS